MERDEIARAGGWGLSADCSRWLPERMLVAIESIAERLEDIHPMRQDVETIRRQSADLDEMLPALMSLKEDLGGRLDNLHELITALHRTVGALKRDVERVTECLPEPDEPGPFESTRCPHGGCRVTSASAMRRGPAARLGCLTPTDTFDPVHVHNRHMQLFDLRPRGAGLRVVSQP
jgi:hypothetical protein